MSHTGKITAVLAGLAFLSGGLSASASDGMHYVAAENRFLGPEISCELSEEAGDTGVLFYSHCQAECNTRYQRLFFRKAKYTL